MGAGLPLRNRVEVVSERDVGWHLSLQVHPLGRTVHLWARYTQTHSKGVGLRLHQEALSLLGAHNLRDLVCFSGYWEGTVSYWAGPEDFLHD